MQTYLYYISESGSTREDDLPLTDNGYPIVPSKGDLIYTPEGNYKVSSIAWDFGPNPAVFVYAKEEPSA